MGREVHDEEEDKEKQVETSEPDCEEAVIPKKAIISLDRIIKAKEKLMGMMQACPRT